MSRSPVTDVCVVHLVWAPLGRDRLGRFVESYVGHRAGVKHRLLVLYNGFGPEEDLGPWEDELAGVPHEVLRLGEPVLDLDAYWEAVERVPAGCYCFLNSYSAVLADGWLGFMVDALGEPRVGLVGASGSWASLRSLSRFNLGLRGPYAPVFAPRAAVRRELWALEERRDSDRGHASSSPSWLQNKLIAARRAVDDMRGFAPFPAPHLRTNAFMADREILLGTALRPIGRKNDAHRLESGQECITAQVHRRGLEARVVGRDGRAYGTSDWPASNTFWQGEQENLLVADNQTEDYRRGGPDLRALLSAYAWGDRGQPH